MTFTPGENVGPYRIIEQLGQGGMATVFRAYHPSLDRDVALKVLHPVFKQDPQFFSRFQREARIVARLEHPHIIPVYDFNEHNGEPYLVMRYIKGDTLKAHLGDGPLRPEKVLQIIRPVSKALTYAHGQGVLHRDIKPSNIMLADDGNIFLTDFGLARMTQAGASTLSQDMIVGTPQYISPEQAQGLTELGERTDIYSLGVVLFEMLVGSLPYNADTPFAIVHDHIYTPLPLPRSLNPDLDQRVERTILKALAKDPEERFESIEKMLGSLESSLGTQASNEPKVAVTPAASPARGRPPTGQTSPWLGLGLASVTILALVLGAFLLRSRLRQHEPTSIPVAEVTPQPAGGLAGQEPNPIPPDRDADRLQAPADVPPQNLAKAEALRHRAEELAQQGEVEAALAAYDEAIELAPFQTETYHLAGTLLLQHDHYDEALGYYEAAVQARPDNPEAWFQLGKVRLVGDDLEGFYHAVQESAALAPSYAPAHAGLGFYHLSQGNLDRARQEIELALELAPNSAEAHLVNAIYLRRTGTRQEVIAELRAVLQNRQVAPLTRQQAQRILEELGVPLRDQP